MGKSDCGLRMSSVELQWRSGNNFLQYIHTYLQGFT